MPSKIDLFHGDNRRVLRALRARGVQFDSCVTDPPYGLTSIVKRFGAPGAQAARTEGTDGSFSRLSGGFMGKKWDGTQIERDPAFWALVLDVLKPGAYCFAFSSAMTGHWQAVAMEQAGFVMHPMHVWLSAQGFPKPKWSDEEKARAYGTASVKPSLDPIYLGQKPFSEKTGPANIARHGTGALEIEDCRTASGAYPSNVHLDYSDEADALVPHHLRHLYHRFQFAQEDAAVAIYHPKAGGNDRHGGKHPTVKPIALMQYLIRHVTPKGGKVLDPFAGSGTTGIAARREGCDCTLIEQEDEYMAFLGKRLGVAPQKTAHRVRNRPLRETNL